MVRQNIWPTLPTAFVSFSWIYSGKSGSWSSKASLCVLSLVEQADKPFYEITNDIKRYSLGTHWINPGPGYLPLIGKLKRFLKAQEIDIIIDIDIVLDVLSIPAAKRLKTKVISWEHFNCEFEQSVLYRKWISRLSAKKADYIVTLTEQDKQSYGKLLKRTSDIEAIYNLVAPMKLDERKKRVLQWPL